jgi:polysaccharide export outer membrane protein
MRSGSQIRVARRFQVATFCVSIGLASISIFSTSLGAQEQERPRRDTGDISVPRRPEPSDLAKDNFNRVAANATEIKAVLAKDSGLLVELKRWVAKEATDNGQIVDDATLNDQAIFDRLAQDVEFRSVATRLLQRYGYLMPTVNPDSQYAKEQDLILKERARHLVQVESQEDSGASRPNDLQRTGKRDSDCSDPAEDRDCNSQNSIPRRQKANRPQEGAGSEESLSSLPNQQRTQGTDRILQTRDRQEDPMLGGPIRPNADTGFDEGLHRSGSGMGILDSLNDPLGRQIQDDYPDRINSNMPSNGSEKVSTRTHETGLPTDRGRSDIARRKNPETNAAVNAPVAMIHRANPYADIPSLYDMYVQAASNERVPKRFGLALFENLPLDSDIVPMDLPVGPDYVVGPGDGVTIDLWGGVSQRIVRVVDREGRITLPEVGPLLVSGRTLGDVQTAVQHELRSQYRDTSADVSLSRLRTIRVYIVGEVETPGAYDISSLSTPLNALFAAGGITQRGSLRALKHYRGKQLLEDVDIYDLLLRGISSNQQRLENGDTLVVPPVGSQVEVTGMVRRPGIFELHGETQLGDILELAGGILPAAALRHVEVQRVEAHEKRVMLSLDLSESLDSSGAAKQLDSFEVHDGDAIHIFPIAPYNESAIYLQGHVIRPGRYSYRDGMKLNDLIASYGDLLPEPAQHYGEIIRLNAPDFHPSVESFDLAAALANPAAAPKLQPLDTVRIFSRFDFEQAPTVWIGGEVRAPGKYRTSGQAHLRDALFLAGGVSPDASLDSAQLFRTEKNGTLRILSVNLGGALAGNPVDNILLEPRDRLLIQRNSLRVDPPTVYVKGEVGKPGRYPLTSNMSADDLIRVAGGLKRSADPASADLTHYVDGETQGLHAENLSIPLSISARNDSNVSVPLRDGDVLTIRQSPGWNDLGASITLRGEVQHPGSYGLKPGERLSSVLERAGGFSAEAYPYGAVLMRREVRDLELKSHSELIQRVKAEQSQLRALPENDTDQKNLKLTAIAQTETTLNQLEANAPVGRVVIHIQPEMKGWQKTPADVVLRDGDVLLIPKKANYVAVSGQVYNQTAVSFQPGRSARWYLSQAGGLTQIADKKAVFVIRADGSVISASNNATWWSGDPLNATLRPGDSIVVPEKAPKIGTRNWSALIQSAQIATSLALTVATLRP